MTNLANQSDLNSAASHTNALDFLIDQKLAQIWTSIPVQVKGVTPGAGLLAGTVDVQPLVNQIDGDGAPTAHGKIYGLPVMRLQGGTSAIILDPVVGDKGDAFFCHRDVSAVNATRQQSNPGSFRRFDPADAYYLGGLLNAVPTTYVQLDGSGNINATSTGTITLHAPSIVLNGAVSSMGAFTNNGHNIGNTHEHVGVQSGTSNTGTVV